MKKLFLIFAIPLLISLNANALFEIRAGYGVQTPGEQDVSATQNLSTMSGFNLDAIVELPMVPVGLGLRYEDMGFDFNQSGVSFESEMQRTSILVNYRIIDMFLYFGAIGSIGLVNDASISAPGNKAEFKSSMTYSLGVEGGLSLGLMQVGAELGYLGANFEEDTNVYGSDLDLSGMYAKILVGVGF